jgi:hypothetical protein
MPQGFVTQSVGVSPHLIFQMKKSGTFSSFTGQNRAMTIQFEQKSDATMVSLGEQKWMDKAAVGAAGLILWPLFITAAYGAYKQSELPEEIWQIIDSNAYVPSYGAQPAPAPAPAYVPTPPPAVAPAPQTAQSPQQAVQGPRFCPDCGTKNAGSKFCPGCGKQLY